MTREIEEHPFVPTKNPLVVFLTPSDNELHNASPFWIIMWLSFFSFFLPSLIVAPSFYLGESDHSDISGSHLMFHTASVRLTKLLLKSESPSLLIVE